MTSYTCDFACNTTQESTAIALQIWFRTFILAMTLTLSTKQDSHHTRHFLHNLYVSATFGNRHVKHFDFNWFKLITLDLSIIDKEFFVIDFYRFFPSCTFFQINFPGMLTSKSCREVSFGYFWMRFLGIDRETCQETHCARKRKFFFKKISRKLRKTKFLFLKIFNFPGM